MAFLDDIDKKIAMISQGAMKKTREVAGAAKISSAIKEEQLKQDQYFKQIGLLYYNDMGNEATGEYAKLCRLAEESILRVQALNEELQIIKGGQVCPNCGSQLPASSAFCNYCGTKIEQKRQNDFNVLRQEAHLCQQCGAEVEEDQMFCNRCGARIGEAAQHDDVWEIQEAEKVFCMECGAELEQGQTFCMQCGAKVMNENDDILFDGNGEAAIEKVYCNQCGNEIENGQVFCTQCGHKIQ